MKQIFSFLLIFFSYSGFAQYCDSITPYFYADLSASTNASWISPNVVRDGNCCGTTNPDNCIEFEILLHPQAVGIVFDFYSGAVPPGALFYQVNCGPVVQVGDPICLNGPGPHHLTFCKPGNNSNEYLITSIPAPQFGPDVITNEGCSIELGVSGFDETTVSWNSIAPGMPGDYDGYLNCTSGCDTVEVSAGLGAPGYIDYLVCGSSSNPCDSLPMCDTIRVTIQPTLSVNISPGAPVICYGDSTIELTANASGGIPPYNYQWSNGANQHQVQLGGGMHSVIITDASGCGIAYDTVTVFQFQQPITANAGVDQHVCISNLPINVNGVVTGVNSGIWTGGSGSYLPINTSLSMSYHPSNQEIQNGSVELYLSTTSNMGCPAGIDTIQVFLHSFSDSVQLITNNISCFGESDGEVMAIVNGGNGPYTYSWNNGGSNSSINGLNSGGYQVTIANMYGCDTSMNTLIVEPMPVQLNLFGQNVNCYGGNDGSVDLSVTGGTGNYNLLWNNLALPFPAGLNNLNIGNLPASNYNVSVNDQNGCADSGQIALSEPLPIELVMEIDDSVCFGVDINGSSSVTGGVGPYNYHWSTGAITPNVQFQVPASGYTSLSITDQNGCSTSDSGYTFVQQLFQDSLAVFSSGDICFGDSVQLSSVYYGQSTNLQYLWEPCGCAVPGPIILSPTINTTYVLEVRDECNNVLEDSVQVVVHPLPEVELPIHIAEGCSPLQVDFPSDTSWNQYDLEWNFGDGVEGDGMAPSHNYLAAGTYLVQLTATNAFGCEASTGGSHSVVVRPTPEAQIEVGDTKKDMYYPVFDFKSMSTGATSHHWSVGDGTIYNQIDVSHTYEAVGSYEIYHWVINPYGCRDTAKTIVQVDPTVSVFIPNAFTPDGDGVNDEFFIKGSGMVNDDFEMNIFDRWGELIFTSNNLNRTWKGEVNGIITAKQDVYVYTVMVKDIFGEFHEFKGHVSLLK